MCPDDFQCFQARLCGLAAGPGHAEDEQGPLIAKTDRPQAAPGPL